VSASGGRQALHAFPTRRSSDLWWNDAHTARWVAEDGIRRMQEVLGDGFTTSALAPRAYLIAGFANRILGESVCQAVIDGGAPTRSEEHTSELQSRENLVCRLLL